MSKSTDLTRLEVLKNALDGIADGMALTVIRTSRSSVVRTGLDFSTALLSANGELIGTAFDGNWEAMSGDIAFENDVQRTISVDIRYILFIIDKFANAGHLIEEMTLSEKDGAENKR